MKLKIKLVPITQYQTPYTALSLSFPLYFSLALTHSVFKCTYSFQSLTFILYLSLGPLTSVFFVLPRSFYNTSFSLSLPQHSHHTCSYTLLSSAPMFPNSLFLFLVYIYISLFLSLLLISLSCISLSLLSLLKRAINRAGQ